MDPIQTTTTRKPQDLDASGSSSQRTINDNGQSGVLTDEQQEQILMPDGDNPVQLPIGGDGQGSTIQTGGTHVTVDSVRTILDSPIQSQLQNPIGTGNPSHITTFKTVAEDQQPSISLDTAHPDAQQQQQQQSADPKNAVLAGTTIEEIEKPDKQQEPDNSPAPQPQDPNKGHYETKPSGVMMWGFVLCCCVLSAPLGGGFAFLLTPAQFASFGLVVFWKEGKRKVWKLDKKSLPGDSLVTTQENLEEMITNAENGTPDNILTQVPDGQVDALLAEMVQGLPQEQQQQAMEDLSAFAAAMQAIAISEGMSPEEAQQMTSFIASPERNNAMLKSLHNSGIKEAMESFISAADDQAKHSAAEQLVKSLTKVTQEIAPATEDFPHKELLAQLMGNDPNLTKKLIEDLAARQDVVRKNASPLLKLGTPDQVPPKSHVSARNGQRSSSTPTPGLPG